MLKTTSHLALLGACVLTLAACDVRKTQEGNVTVPKYEVEKTQEGSVTPPKYEVTPPDVKVGTQEKTVTVPTIKPEEKKVEVPSVTVTPAKDR